MQYRPFGKTNLSVSALGIGSIGIRNAEGSIVQLMNQLLDAGCNLVDTAACYEGSEDLIGRHFRHRRDEIILVSKCGHHDVLPDGSMRSRPIDMDDIDRSLRLLRTDYLDAMLLHSYDFDLLLQGDALAVLEQARDAGKVRWIGYSGDNERVAWAANDPRIDVVEWSANLADQWNLQKLGGIAVERGLAVIAKRPLANAAWRYAADPGQASHHHRQYACRFKLIDLKHADYACDSMAELALRFTISDPAVATAIASTTHAGHLHANLMAVEKGPLPPDYRRDIIQRFQQAESLSGGTWQSCN